MKLQNKKSKTTKIVVIVIAAVILIGLIVGAILLFGGSQSTPEPNPTDIVGISMSAFPNMEYTEGDEFEADGAKIQVLTYDMQYTRFVDHTQLSFSGFDSSSPVDEQVITVTYAGFTTTFTVKISEKPSATPVPVGIEVYGFQETYNRDTWKFADSVVRGTSLKVVFSDDSMSESILINPEWMYGWSKNAPAGNVTLTIKYNYNGTMLEKVITVTITE